MQDDLPTLKKKHLERKEEDKREFGELFDEDSDSEDDILVRAERKKERYTASKKGRRRQRKGNDDEEDIDSLDDDDDDEDDYDEDDGDDLEDEEEEVKPAKVNPMSKVKGKIKVMEEGEDKEDIVQDFNFWSDGEDETTEPKRKKKKLEKKKTNTGQQKRKFDGMKRVKPMMKGNKNKMGKGGKSRH